ncbi:hypothetical protein S7711_07541 [Stachybotrys chartarum IBT 7711]|uniref:F-box domain-containing protein n=1 Tax=Stachybotrys chartarum (strain CBS 109288 / IBT 7711) TaxID=1280523 RepID=A0A084AN75_STACB|nr:hypothetical protein S7711_07541 [Stachybotrys chartarum IBT 7711]KFA46092.1 hypothetical protein S40293_07745 [Stachybotrys chartarum IBT 40293]KFA74319.1 hypothetical protein S40288_03711 [Stachybotrys chartarum IBT 40288]
MSHPSADEVESSDQLVDRAGHLSLSARGAASAAAAASTRMVKDARPGGGDDDDVDDDVRRYLAAVRPPLDSSNGIEELPNEVLLHVLGYLDVSDLLATSRTSHLLRSLSLAPILHQYRLRHCRLLLPPLLTSPSRPSLADLIARHIFLTNTSVVSRRLARSLVSIRLARRLAARPSAEALVERAVLPPECVPGRAAVHVAPSLVATRKAIEKERLKDGLKKWMAVKWRRAVAERQELAKQTHESRGIGRVWRLTRFWERMSKGEYSGVLSAR